MFVNTKEFCKCKAVNKNVNFSCQFCLGSTCNKFNEIEEVSFKGNVYDFSVDYNATGKSNILNIHKYLMVMNNIKKCDLLNKIGKLYFSGSLATKFSH